MTCRACGSPKHPGMNCKLAELVRKQSPVNTPSPVNSIANTSVNTPANTQPVNCLQCDALRQRIAELEARLDKLSTRPSRAQYMREYMRRRRSEKKVPGAGEARRV